MDEVFSGSVAEAARHLEVTSVQLHNCLNEKVGVGYKLMDALSVYAPEAVLMLLPSNRSALPTRLKCLPNLQTIVRYARVDMDPLTVAYLEGLAMFWPRDRSRAEWLDMAEDFRAARDEVLRREARDEIRQRRKRRLE